MKFEPVATYRLQMHPGFGFDQAAEIVPYLHDLGISHMYTSPYLQAAAGSTHGYDIVDPAHVNAELGGTQAHARLCETIRAAGLGHMIDVVPNHMAVAGRQNPWWWDLLENGPASRFAGFFDVDWHSGANRWPGKLLLPVLGNHYGRILEDGELQLSYEDGNFAIHYHEHLFPVAPSSAAEILSTAGEDDGSKESRIKTEVTRLNHDPDALDTVIEQQHYRLAFWRMADTDLGYRRFFNISDLAGIRVEDKTVFAAVHALPLAWVKKGWVQGLRIDHPDGLWDPAQYFHRLQKACPDAWIVVEKILEPKENLASDWPVAGTTGYDFMNLAGGLFVNPASEEVLTQLYADFTGIQQPFEALVHECKHLVLTTILQSEIRRLTSLFEEICERHRRHRDYSRQELRRALCQTAIHFPVYRSYVSASENRVSEEDEHHIDAAIEGAAMVRSDLDPELFLFLKDLLLLQTRGALETELAMRFQQLTGPAMAKGVEDTAFYRYHRLICLNEVGGDPGRFTVTLRQFHTACARAQKEHPLGLLASTTHDTKRSEDVRARLALLSEIPDPWADAVRRWASNNARHRSGGVPDANTEYLLYQTLVGAWPIDLERICAYMEKAVKEAKVHTSWTAPNNAYERGLADFIAAVLADRAFCTDLENFVADLIAPGRINSLAQTLIKLTAPGVPDIYQGTELWDLSLVDPDNRRPVDFALRRRQLGQLPQLDPEAIMAGMDKGLPKLWVIRQILHLRRAHPVLFGPRADYCPLYATGQKADHLVAFFRGQAVISLAPRLVMGLNNDWDDTIVALPSGKWHNVLTGDEADGGAVRLQELLRRFPVGLLMKRK
ncbi:malto-oligosyltrehalose synthase [Desulfotignum balticum]|uniref:malto-oligosyltrehalose synthase n=1 Tax=Desulfotignum balticum TaxID=115781 RepID=UPI00040834DA|nr:malto-oligosyltrehalose synthase [Desulfotignum balticum]